MEVIGLIDTLAVFQNKLEGVGFTSHLPCSAGKRIACRVGHLDGARAIRIDDVVVTLSGSELEDEGVGTRTTIERIATSAAAENIVSTTAGNRVVVRIAGEHVGASAADEIDRVGAKQTGETGQIACHHVRDERTDNIAVSKLIDVAEPGDSDVKIRYREAVRGAGVGQAITERDRIEIATHRVVGKRVVDRLSAAARLEDDRLFRRIRKQVRLLGAGILISRKISWVAGKISKALRRVCQVKVCK